ncbi:hypothetical protein LXL04_023433 [Taraxacum kok-saghyz]
MDVMAIYLNRLYTSNQSKSYILSGNEHNVCRVVKSLYELKQVPRQRHKIFDVFILSSNPDFFQERAILTPKNEIVQEINDRLLSLFPGDEKEYLSADNLCNSDQLHKDFDENVLNGLKPPGLPLHKLVLKVGIPVMLLRNIDQKAGLCNGTRLLVLALGNRVVEAEIVSGSNIGTRTFIPIMSLTPSDKRIPFTFQRRQFPLAVCFAMTINKSQEKMYVKGKSNHKA